MGFWEAVSSAGPYANSLHLASDIFTGQVLFLTPSQQCQSTKDTLYIYYVTKSIMFNIQG